MIDSVARNRFEEALASGKLKELADQMSVEGLSQAAIYDRFESFWRFLGDARRDADEEILACCLESIIGWCGPGNQWFDHYLTNEEIEAYRRTNG